MAERIGAATCPLCKAEALASVMKTKRVCLTCNRCKFQGFARGDRSDELLRAFIVGALPPDPPAPAPAAAPAAAPAPVPAPARSPAAAPGNPFLIG